MAHFIGYRFPVPEARLLASLESIHQDVLVTIAYCDRLQGMRQSPFDSLLWEAVSAAAVVRYARCFATGARTKLEHDLVNSAPPGIREAHEYIIAVRSKHVAHSVNEFEENEVTVTLREDGESVEICGIGAHQGRVAGLPFGWPDRLQELSEWLLNRVQTEITAEREKLLLLAQSCGAQSIQAYGIPSAGTDASVRAAKTTRSRP